MDPISLWTGPEGPNSTFWRRGEREEFRRNAIESLCASSAGPRSSGCMHPNRRHTKNILTLSQAQQQDGLIQKAALQNQNALQNIDAALQYVLSGANEHPNRLDIVEQYTKGLINPTQPTAPLGANVPAVNPLGQPSQIPPASAFGAGQSILGQAPNPLGGQGAFGAPAPAFGQPGLGSNPLAAQPFGTQAPVQPPQPIPFGQQAPLGGIGAFGQPGGFQQNAPNPLLAQPQVQQAPSPFSPVQPQPLGAFGQPQAQQPAQATPFRQPAAQPASGFSTGASPFGAAPTAPSGFQQGGGQPFVAAPPGNIQAPNPFSPIPQQQAAQGQQSGFSAAGGQVADPSPYPPGSNAQHPHPSTYSSRDASNRITMFKGRPVVYKDNQPGFQNSDGSWEKIWFPNGPPGYYSATELPEEGYDQATKEAYEKLRLTGELEGGKLPLLPPRREWSKWDF
jgi:nucleoporin NUP42